MDALKAKGNAAFKDKKFAEAIKFYTEAINMDPNSEAAGALGKIGGSVFAVMTGRFWPIAACHERLQSAKSSHSGVSSK